VLRFESHVLSLATMPETQEMDLAFMSEALAEAREAAERGEIPIGAVLVLDEKIIARAGNRTITHCDPTAHAEILALRDAAHRVGNYRLLGVTLYVTIEPCAMCAGAMIQARIARLVYGADEAKGGAVHSCFEVLSHDRTNHRVEITGGVRSGESIDLLQKFFSTRRARTAKDQT
jgi:tRNA(adenine34) deaminase